MRLIKRAPNSSADNPSARNLEGQPSGRGEIESLAHVLFALATAAASLLFAALLLWPDNSESDRSRGLVRAAEPVAKRAARTNVDSLDRLAQTRRVPIASRAAAKSVDDNLAATPEFSVLRCELVDEDWRPVSGAEVWIDEDGWRRVGTSQHDGAFDLSYDASAWQARFDDGGRVQLGARDPDHGPALVTTLRALPEAAVQLVLRGRGAGLRLDITDRLGRPIAGARISFNDSFSDERLPLTNGSLAVLGSDGRYQRPTPVPLAVTNSWGQVQLRGLEPGERRLSIESAGYCTHQERVRLMEGDVLVQRLQLDHAAGVRGRVLRIDGGPVRGTIITGLGPDPSSEVSTTCDARGQFELAGLPAGPVQLFAEYNESQQVTHSARVETTLLAGDLWRWEPTLRPVERISGRLTDSNGNALVGWRVESRGNSSRDDTLTQADGSYELPSPRTVVASRLFFFHPLADGRIPSYTLELESVDLDAADQELPEGLEIASTIRGRVLMTDGSAANSQPLVVHRLNDFSSLTLYPDLSSGSFETPALPPGDYMLIFPDHGQGWAPDQKYSVDGQAVLNVGAITLPGQGSLKILTQSVDRREDCFEMRMELKRPGIGAGRTLPVFVGVAEIPQQFLLAPGDYRIEFPTIGDGFVKEIRIESGQPMHFVLPVNE